MPRVVTNMIEADLMIILTNQDGYFDKNPDQHPNAKIIKKCNISEVDEDSFSNDDKSTFGTGGFKTKIKSVKMVTNSKCTSIIASGYEKNVIKKILDKKSVGTTFYLDN